MASKELFVSYPFRIVHGMTARSNRDDHVREMIEQVLFTIPGERVMYPEFGCGLSRLVFETANNEIATATQALVSADLQRWLGDVISVRAVTIEVHESTLSVDVLFETLETRESRVERFQR